MLWGVKRGLFSNEAGMGSAPNVAATAQVRHPAEQGVIQALSVFIDTVILCTCTAVIILLSHAYAANPGGGGIALTQSALAEHVGAWGRWFVSLALVLFAFTTILYNYFLGETALSFVVGEKRLIFNIYRVLALVLIMWGSLQDLSTAFGFSDLLMGFLALVNLAALLLLFKTGLNSHAKCNAGIDRSCNGSEV